MSQAGQEAPAGRLAGKKAPSYLRAVNVPEARASAYTARYMLVSDIAYVLSAAELGHTPEPTARTLIRALLRLIEELDSLDTTTPPGDIVSQRESWVTERVGRADGGWLHLGRNRGESLRVYLPRMFFRQTLHEARQAVAQLLDALVSRAEPVLDAVAPNYHHLQHSGFATLGEYLLSWVATFAKHLDRIEQADRRLDYGPPTMTARPAVHELYDLVNRRLGFSGRARLRREAIWTHDQFTEPFFVLSLIWVDLARLAQDLRIWMTPEFGLFEPADEHAGGSSALPHAKVPFGFQAVIGGATLAATRLAGEMAAAVNPSEGSEPLYQSATLYAAAADAVASTIYIADVIAKGHFNLDEMQRKSTTDYAGSSEAHDKLVFEYGVPFRAGHRILGSLARAHHLGEPAPDLRAMLKQETGRDIDVDQDDIMDIVLGNKLAATTFDLPGLRRIWSEAAAVAKSASERANGPSPVERATAVLLEDAQRWAEQ
jgi:argininosuccinate lyase